MEDETLFYKTIKKILNMICPQYGVRISDTLIQSWKIALHEIDPNHIAKAAAVVLKDQSFKYMPKTGEFREICLRIKRSEVSRAETSRNPQIGGNVRNNEISKFEARKIQAAIKNGLPSFEKIPCPKIDLMEYTDSDGKTTKIVAYGHVDIEQFQNNCANQFFAKIKRAFHGYHREERRTGKEGREFRTMVQCGSDSGGSPITIGIV